jgi:RES domain-containing protein
MARLSDRRIAAMASLMELCHIRGRWNSPGRRVIYAAETYAGAMLAVLANANIGRMPKHHAWIEILIGGDVSVEELDQRASRSLVVVKFERIE